MLVSYIFYFSRNAFYRIEEKLHHFSHIEIVVCKRFQFGQG